MLDFKHTYDTEISEITFGYIPTSIYLDGIQTYAYNIIGNTVYFNNNIPANTIIIATPPDAIRILDDAITTINVPDNGIHSIFSAPFGNMLFSSDSVIWVKSLTIQCPATIYCKIIPHDSVTDCLCKVDIEIIVWRGNDFTFVNEDGIVEINDPSAGGIEYHVL
jgi:hypothetical protein